MCVPLVSEKRAVAIAKIYPSLKSLMVAYGEKSS